jgi:hypothetical protein
MASGPVFMFCTPGQIFGGKKGVWSRFHILPSRTYFWQYRVLRFPFSCFACPDSLSAVPRASDIVFMICVPALIFGDTEGVGSRFHVLRARTQFWRYRGRPVQFSFLALPNSFSAVPSASGPVFMFCTPELVFSGTEGVESHFHVSRYRTHFRRYQVRPVQSS